jgi:NAD dependent epimerase/dehydratase family enzyme
VITQGQRVLPQRTVASGYVFRFPELDAALADLFTSAPPG